MVVAVTVAIALQRDFQPLLRRRVRVIGEDDLVDPQHTADVISV